MSVKGSIARTQFIRFRHRSNGPENGAPRSLSVGLCGQTGARGHVLPQVLPTGRTSCPLRPTGTTQRGAVCHGCPRPGGACVSCGAVCTPGPRTSSLLSADYRSSLQSRRLGEKEWGAWGHGHSSGEPTGAFGLREPISWARPPRGDGAWLWTPSPTACWVREQPRGHGQPASGQLDASRSRLRCLWTWPSFPPTYAMCNIHQQKLKIFSREP